MWSSSSDPTDNYIQLVEASPISSSYLSVTTQTPFRKTVQIKGETEFGNYNSLSLDITICGNEVLTSKPLSSNLTKLLFNLNDVFSIAKSTYDLWFEVTNADH